MIDARNGENSAAVEPVAVQKKIGNDDAVRKREVDAAKGKVAGRDGVAIEIRGRAGDARRHAKIAIVGEDRAAISLLRAIAVNKETAAAIAHGIATLHENR